MYIKKNKYFITFVIMMIIITLLSFCHYFYDNFSYVKQYNRIESNCLKENNSSDEICNYFQTEQQLQDFLDLIDPVKAFRKIDAISLTYSVIQNTIFSALQYFSPLLIIFSVVGTLHTEYASGMFKNYFLRMDYKKYLKQKYKIVLKTAAVIPITLILIFVISCIITGFNFEISENIKSVYIYKEWKYSNFILYGFLICLIQFFISVFYGNIGVICCISNKNNLVSIIMGYLMFLAVNLFMYIILYATIINKMLGFRNLTDIFAITGYWFFDKPEYYWGALLMAFILQFISLIIVRFLYYNKKGVINAYEKQMA